MTITEITEAIKNQAKNLGFTHVGIVEAVALESEKILLQEWLEKKYDATMKYIGRDIDRKTDPKFILENVESVISLGMNYYSPFNHSKDKNVGKISRYAWGEDYHEIISDKLKILISYISSIVPDSVNVSYVDSGPTMDKAWAVRSGIGWLGKNTNVVTRDFGSWIFLGEIFSSATLNYDLPIKDYCGKCTRCLDACPTKAFVQPYVLDSNKCISFQTIESKEDSIPAELGVHFDNWIFGCDICQDVCPWNSFAISTDDMRLYPVEKNLYPNLTELDQIDREEFSERFKISPMRRTKWNGLKRNIRNALDVTASYYK